MKILVIGRGAREHALGWKIKQSPSLEELYFAPGNAATSSLGKNIPLEPDQIPELADWASNQKIDLTVVGPENSLMHGIGEEFSRRGLLLFGPSRSGAMLEGSKSWTKEFLIKHAIPTPLAREFTSFKTAQQYLARRSFPLVIKADGLAQGKGVVVCHNKDEALAALHAFLIEKTIGEAGETVLIEDYMAGREVSVFALCDAERLCYLGEVLDYKRVYDGDHGPNTGGMGAVSDPAFLDERVRREIIEKILKPTLHALKQENIVYRGVLFAGLMLTREGAKVLEYNVRFGDPETQALLPRVDEDLLPLLKAAACGELSADRVLLKQQTTVGVVIAANGYPGKVHKGVELPLLDPWPPDVLLFHASTVVQNGKTVNGGGRTLTAVACEDSLERARNKVYQTLERHSWGSYFYRKDIGTGLVPLPAGN